VYGTGGANLNPNANAGSNQTVAFGSIVTLNGSGSYDADGTIASYEWTQSAGSTVGLSSTTLPEVTFTAPSSEDSLSFTLTVTDDDGATGTATVFVKTAQGVSNAVFFSEWAEGTSYNKYIEIYNATGEEIDLSNYKVSSCANGCDTSGEWDYPDQVVFDAGTMLASGDVFVLAHPSADESILDQADNTSFTYMSNGNDAVGLVSTTTGFIVDLIGDMSNSPPDAWDVAGTPSATAEQTIVRKPSVLNGNTDWAASAGTDASNSEWLVFDQNVWDNLGFHNQGVDAPSVTISSISPVFLTDQTEIEFSAAVTVPTGSVSSVIVKYGTNDQLVNEQE
jgi:predicted extracellular nuclease